MSERLLDARGVTVRFGGLTAVDGVDAAFHVAHLLAVPGLDVVAAQKAAGAGGVLAPRRDGTLHDRVVGDEPVLPRVDVGRRQIRAQALIAIQHLLHQQAGALLGVGGAGGTGIVGTESHADHPTDGRA